MQLKLGGEKPNAEAGVEEIASCNHDRTKELNCQAKFRTGTLQNAALFVQTKDPFMTFLAETI